MWLLFQSVIMVALSWTGIYYEWTPNNVALGIVAVGAAWAATKIVSSLPTLWRTFRALLARALGRDGPYMPGRPVYIMSGADVERQRGTL